MKDRIYMDFAATTPVAPEVMEEMLPFFTENYGNPSSIHGSGRESRKAAEQARGKVAELLHVPPRDLYFTSGGSESDNWALKGAAFAQQDRGRRILVSAVEHHAVLDACKWLQKQNFEVVFLPVDRYGTVSPETVEENITEGTVLISVMAANNEIGTLQPVREIGEIARKHGILFHTDAVQAAGAVLLDAEEIRADLISISAHKIYGPKGTGALYIRGGTRMDALIHGGAQERGLRAGTENLAGIVGFGKAAELAAQRMTSDSARLTALRDRLIHGIQERIPGAVLNGHPTERLPNNCHFSFPGLEGEALLLRLDLAGIAASAGSACTAGSMEPSHVLLAVGQAPELANGSLRLTLGRETTEAEIDEVLEVLPKIAADLRGMRSGSW